MVAAEWVRPALTRLGHLLGRRCQLCASVVTCDDEFPLCGKCQDMLAPRRGGYCPRCGMCYADPATPVYPCGQCRTSPPPWSAMAFHGPYRAVLKDLIHQHKFKHDHGLGQVLRLLIRQAWEQHRLARPHLLIPVPMLPRRVAARGFNQSLELARILARYLDVAVSVDAVRKTRDTFPQSSLGRAARLRNLDGAFEASDVVAGCHVLLVDDVVTTGATLRAGAEACLKAGAVRVDVFVLGRAL